jgi:hypothetical protein
MMSREEAITVLMAMIAVAASDNESKTLSIMKHGEEALMTLGVTRTEVVAAAILALNMMEEIRGC